MVIQKLELTLWRGSVSIILKLCRIPTGFGAKGNIFGIKLSCLQDSFFYLSSVIGVCVFVCNESAVYLGVRSRGAVVCVSRSL